MARYPKTKRPPRKETPEARARRLANLRPIKPGEVRNPQGKTGVNWRQKVQDYFATEHQDITDKTGGRKVPRIENVMASLYKNALLGREPSIAMVFDAMDVTAPQKLELTGADGEPLNGAPPVLFVMGDAGTTEDADPLPADPAAPATPSPEAPPPPDSESE